MLTPLLLTALIQAAAPTHPGATDDPATCPAVEAATAAREWADFEFSTETPGGPMWLASRGCYARAAEAARDYLARGPLLTVRQQAITRLHRGRNLAFAGQEAAAAQAVASARRSDQTSDAPLDWNAYVEGLYGFLVKDRDLLDSRLAALSARPGQGDAVNAANLARLSLCFERSYMEAQTATECAVAPAP